MLLLFLRHFTFAILSQEWAAVKKKKALRERHPICLKWAFNRFIFSRQHCTKGNQKKQQQQYTCNQHAESALLCGCCQLNRLVVKFTFIEFTLQWLWCRLAIELSGFHTLRLIYRYRCNINYGRHRLCLSWSCCCWCSFFSWPFRAKWGRAYLIIAINCINVCEHWTWAHSWICPAKMH